MFCLLHRPLQWEFKKRFSFVLSIIPTWAPIKWIIVSCCLLSIGKWWSLITCSTDADSSVYSLVILQTLIKKSKDFLRENVTVVKISVGGVARQK